MRVVEGFGIWWMAFVVLHSEGRNGTALWRFLFGMDLPLDTFCMARKGAFARVGIEIHEWTIWAGAKGLHGTAWRRNAYM